jgi:hypothetical protein
LRRVPWATTSAVDRRTVEPAPPEHVVDADIQDRLADLGYL